AKSGEAFVLLRRTTLVTLQKKRGMHAAASLFLFSTDEGLFSDVGNQFCCAGESVGALLLFCLDVDIVASLTVEMLPKFVESLRSVFNELVHRSLRFRQQLMEMRNLLLRVFRMVAKTITGLHGIDEDIWRRCQRGCRVQRIIGRAQSRHRAIEAVEFAATRR